MLDFLTDIDYYRQFCIITIWTNCLVLLTPFLQEGHTCLCFYSCNSSLLYFFQLKDWRFNSVIFSMGPKCNGHYGETSYVIILSLLDMYVTDVELSFFLELGLLWFFFYLQCVFLCSIWLIQMLSIRHVFICIKVKQEYLNWCLNYQQWKSFSMFPNPWTYLLRSL